MACTLYRSSRHLQHWFAYSDRTGWVMFPAQVNGWMERGPCPGVDPASLQKVPTWMAFNTGLLEALVARAA